MSQLDHVEKMMVCAAHLRAQLHSELANITLERFWIPDISPELTPNGEADLPSLFAADNVHLTNLGYARLAGSIARSVQ